MLALVLSFVLIGLAHACKAREVLLNWCYFTAAVLQTVGGTLAVITADVSVDAYFSRHKWRAKGCALLWIAAMSLEGNGEPKVISPVYLGAAVPFMYVLLWPRALELRPGKITLSYLLTATFGLWAIANGIWFIYVGMLHKDPKW
jgi:hypothetical protein